MNVKAPQFLTDVYRDLRDRHLLLPVAGLIVALIAVPVLLRKPAEPTAAVPAATAPAAASRAVTSAVLVDDNVSVRNYRKRLAKLKSKNPFDQHFGLDQSGGGSSGDGGGGSTAPADSTAAPADSGSTASTPPADTGSTGGDSTGGGSTGGGSTGSGGDSGSSTPSEPEIHFFAGRVDVTVGPLGKGKEYDNVKYLTFLPNDKAPLAAFVGLTGSGRSERAVFALSGLAEVSGGDGTCAPHKPDPCEFLTLKPGQFRYLKFDGKTYRLKVRDTHVVEIKDPRDQTASGKNAVVNHGGGSNGSNADGNGGSSTG